MYVRFQVGVLHCRSRTGRPSDCPWQVVKGEEGWHFSCAAAVIQARKRSERHEPRRGHSSWAGAINDVPRRSFRLAVDFERTTFDGGAAAADMNTEINRKTKTVIISRAQINS
jgi:hypothetical protein